MIELDDDEDVFYEGVDYNGLWVVLQGKINLIKESPNTDALSVKGKLGPGDYVGSFARADNAEADLGCSG